MRARSPCHPVIGDEPRLAYNRVLLSSAPRIDELIE
jgi:NAD(P)H-nitrite reductase large subunit